MLQRSERVIVETTRYRISGTITLPAEGYRSRMSDFLNSSEREFIALTDAVLEPHADGVERIERDFIALARAHIVFVAPADESAADDERWLPPGSAAHAA